MEKQKMLKAALVVTIASLATISVGGTSVHAQVAQGSSVVVEPKASAATQLAIRSDRFLTARGSNRSGARARSKKRIVAGAIAGAVGGFFAGGFLGAHIEGDRCDCDDPGVRGFLIGAPIGAAAGGILGAKFLF